VPCLRLGDHDIRRYQGYLWWVKALAGQREKVLQWTDPFLPLTLPDGLGVLRLVPGDELRPPGADEVVSVRFQATGTLHIQGRNGGRKLKRSGRSWAWRPGVGIQHHCCFTVSR
jgi:tRNA(Ile)-lysidine synthase